MSSAVCASSCARRAEVAVAERHVDRRPPRRRQRQAEQHGAELRRRRRRGRLERQRRARSVRRSSEASARSSASSVMMVGGALPIAILSGGSTAAPTPRSPSRCAAAAGVAAPLHRRRRVALRVDVQRRRLVRDRLQPIEQAHELQLAQQRLDLRHVRLAPPQRLELHGIGHVIVERHQLPRQPHRLDVRLDLLARRSWRRAAPAAPRSRRRARSCSRPSRRPG